MSDVIQKKDGALPSFQLGKISFDLPGLILPTGPRGAEHFVNYFLGSIRNENTRLAYMRAWSRFDAWCRLHGLDDIRQVRTLHVSLYLEELQKELAKSTVKQHRAALSKCFDYLVVKQVIEENPAAVVAAPKLKVSKGKTPTLTDDEFLTLIDSIPSDTLIGKRDRAFITLLAYAWPRVSAAVGLKVGDYYPKGKRWYLAISEKGGKEATILLHHRAQDEIDAYISAALIGQERENPLFRSFDRRRQLTERALDRREALAMIKRRAKKAGLHWQRICNHSFRATGITNYMANGGRLDVAQRWANHADPRTTGLYDHSQDKVSLEEVERIRFERDR